MVERVKEPLADPLDGEILLVNDALTVTTFDPSSLCGTLGNVAVPI